MFLAIDPRAGACRRRQIEKLASKPNWRPQPLIPAPGLRTLCQRRIGIPSFRNQRGQICSGVPIQQRRLSEIPRHVLRLCCRPVIGSWKSRPSMLRIYRAHAVWKDVGMKLLDEGCGERTGHLEEDGCWTSFAT
jgi:hypothetical protein